MKELIEAYQQSNQELHAVYIEACRLIDLITQHDKFLMDQKPKGIQIEDHFFPEENSWSDIIKDLVEYEDDEVNRVFNKMWTAINVYRRSNMS